MSRAAPKSARSSTISDASRPSTRSRRPSTVVTTGKKRMASSSPSCMVAAPSAADPREPYAETCICSPR